jgi:hypothetical protein
MLDPANAAVTLAPPGGFDVPVMIGGADVLPWDRLNAARRSGRRRLVRRPSGVAGGGSIWVNVAVPGERLSTVRLQRFGVVLVCVLVAVAGCDRDAPAPSAAGTAGPAAGASAVVPSGVPSASVPSTLGGTSAPPIVTGTSKPPGGAKVAAAAPPCSELKPLVDRYLTQARVTREAPGPVSTCFMIGDFQGAHVEVQLQYGHTTAATTVRKAAGTGCAAAVRPLKLSYQLALGCDNPTATVHSGVALAQGGSFAAAIITVTGDTAATATMRSAVSDAARHLAAAVLKKLG